MTDEKKGTKRKRQGVLFRDACPEIFSMIDRTLTEQRNGLSAEDINSLTVGTSKSIWLRCKDHVTCDGHIWERKVHALSADFRGCPFCNPQSLRFVCKCEPPRLVSVIYPEMFSIIDRNLTKIKEGVTDTEIDSLTKGSSVRVWLRCAKHHSCSEHIWSVKVSQLHRPNRRKCPFCNPESCRACICDPLLLSKRFPNIFAEIDRERTKNLEKLTDYKIDRLLAASGKAVWFKCSKHNTCSMHIWRTAVCARTNGTNCPHCIHKILTMCPCIGSLQSHHPDLAAQWDPDNEEPSPAQVHPKSNKMAKWKCQTCHYRWQMKISQCLKLKRLCPNCSRIATESVGSQECRTVLTEIGKEFKSDATLPNLRSTKNYPLYIDFLCAKQTDPKSSMMAIEYDGEQHFIKPVQWYKTDAHFKASHMNDLIKNMYCGQNGIHLLRISYSIPIDKISNVIRRFFSRITTVSGTQSIIQYVGKEYDAHYHEEW